MKKKHFFTEETKRKIVLEVLSGELTKEQARCVYGIKSKSGILEWMRTFASIHPKSHGVNPMPILQNMKQEPGEIQALKSKIKELEDELKLSQLKGRAYQILVENAKKTYNIDLLKKVGAKQFSSSKKSTDK